MNNIKELVLNHRILQKLIEMNLVTQSEVRRLISEEMIEETPEKSTNRAFGDKLRKITDPQKKLEFAEKYLTEIGKAIQGTRDQAIEENSPFMQFLNTYHKGVAKKFEQRVEGADELVKQYFDGYTKIFKDNAPDGKPNTTVNKLRVALSATQEPKARAGLAAAAAAKEGATPAAVKAAVKAADPKAVNNPKVIDQVQQAANKMAGKRDPLSNLSGEDLKAAETKYGEQIKAIVKNDERKYTLLLRLTAFLMRDTFAKKTLSEKAADLRTILPAGTNISRIIAQAFQGQDRTDLLALLKEPDIINGYKSLMSKAQKGSEKAPEEAPKSPDKMDPKGQYFNPDGKDLKKLMDIFLEFKEEFYNKSYLSEQGDLIRAFVKELKLQVTGELKRKAAMARASVGTRPEMNLAEQEGEDKEQPKGDDRPIVVKRLPNFKADVRTFYEDTVESLKMLKIFHDASATGKNVGDQYKERLILQVKDLQSATGDLAKGIDKLVSEQGDKATIQEQTAAEQFEAMEEVEAAYKAITTEFFVHYKQIEKLYNEMSKEAGSSQSEVEPTKTQEPKAEPETSAKKEPEAKPQPAPAEKEKELVSEFKDTYKYKTKISLAAIQKSAKKIIAILDKVGKYFPNVKPFEGEVAYEDLYDQYKEAVGRLDFTTSNVGTLNSDTVAKGTLVSLRRKLAIFSKDISRIFGINPEVPGVEPVDPQAAPAAGKEEDPEKDPTQQPEQQPEEDVSDEEVQKVLADNKDFYELALRTYLPALENYMQGGSGVISERNDLMNNIDIIKKERKFIEQNFPVFQEKLKTSPETETDAAELQDIGEKLSKSVGDYIKAYDTINEKSEDGNLDQLRRGTKSNIDVINKLQTEVRKHVQFYDAFFKIVQALVLAKEIDEKTLAGQWEALQNAYNKKIPDTLKMVAFKAKRASMQLHRAFNKLQLVTAPLLRSASAGFLRQAGKLADRFSAYFAGASRRAGEELQKQQSTDDLGIDPENMGLRGGLTEEEENKISEEDYASIVKQFRDMASEFMGSYLELKKFSDYSEAALRQAGYDEDQIDLYFKGVMKQEAQIQRLLKQNILQIKKIERFAGNYEEQIVQHVGLFGLSDNAEEEAEDAAKDKPESSDLGSPDEIEKEYVLGLNTLRDLKNRLDDKDNTKDPINSSMEEMLKIVKATMDDIGEKIERLNEELEGFEDIDDLRYAVQEKIDNLISMFGRAQKDPKLIMAFKKQYKNLKTDLFGKGSSEDSEKFKDIDPSKEKDPEKGSEEGGEEEEGEDPWNEGISFKDLVKYLKNPKQRGFRMGDIANWMADNVDDLEVRKDNGSKAVKGKKFKVTKVKFYKKGEEIPEAMVYGPSIVVTHEAPESVDKDIMTASAFRRDTNQYYWLGGPTAAKRFAKTIFYKGKPLLSFLDRFGIKEDQLEEKLIKAIKPLIKSEMRKLNG